MKEGARDGGAETRLELDVFVPGGDNVLFKLSKAATV